MKYLVLLYQDETIRPSLDDAERQGYMQAHMAFDRAVSQGRRRCWAARRSATPTPRPPCATTPTTDPVLTDGPFAETTEQLGGCYLFEAADPDAMTTMAAGPRPAAFRGGRRPQGAGPRRRRPGAGRGRAGHGRPG